MPDFQSGIGGAVGDGIGGAPFGFQPNNPIGYQWGGPTNVGVIDWRQGQPGQQSNNYTGGPGSGDAGLRTYNPSISGPPSPFQAPQFTNSMSNWQGPSGQVSASTPSSGGGFAIPGSNQTIGSAADPYGAAAAAAQRLGGGAGVSPWDPYGTAYGASNAGVRGGTSGPAVTPSSFDQYSAMGALGSGAQQPLGQWPQSVGDPQAAFQSGIYGRETEYGTNPQMWNKPPSTGIGPMQVTPAAGAQYAPGQDIRTQAGNMAAGNQMASSLLNRFGNPSTAAAAYNWGPNRPLSGPWPSSVQDYANNVTNRMANYGQSLGWQGRTSQALSAAGVPGLTLNSNQVAGRY